MKKMDYVVNGIKAIVAVIATATTYFFGDWDTAAIVLCVFIVLDYITGMIYAYITKNISSQIGMKGLLKKFLIIFVLIAAVLLDRLISNDVWVFRTLVCYFYIANEGISILENASKLGIPIPKKLTDKLIQIKGETEESEETE